MSVFCMIRHPTRSTRTAPLFPHPPPVRSPRRRRHDPRTPARHHRPAMDDVQRRCEKGDGLDRRTSDLHARPSVESHRRGEPLFDPQARSEEHTYELQSLMRISYAVFCLKKKNIILLRTRKMQTRSKSTQCII